MIPLPQTGEVMVVHAVVSKVSQAVLHASEPPSNPWLIQLSPLRLVVSHSSPESIVPFPHGSLTGMTQLSPSTQFGGGSFPTKYASHCFSVIVL